MAGDDNTPPPPSSSKIEPSSPYFLGPQDRPSDYITPTRLKGDNYDEWASDIQLALEARRKFGFLDGTFTEPVPPCTQSDWNTFQAMIISWIMNTIDPEIKGTLSKYRDAKKLWDTLKTRFAVVNGPRIQQLKKSIAKCEQTKTMSVASYFGKLSALWEELNLHEPLIKCTCCSNCIAGQLHEQRRDTSRLHQFLMGLYSDFYGQARSNILSQDPLPSLDRAYQLIVQDERLRPTQSAHDEQQPEAVGFAIKTGSGRKQNTPPVINDRPDKSLLVCTHCKKKGHEVSDCFELKGYPEWWFTRTRPSNGRGSSQGKGRGQHPKAQANAAAAGHGTGSAGSEESSSVFTAAQWKALAGFMGNTTIPDNRLNGPIEGADWNEC